MVQIKPQHFDFWELYLTNKRGKKILQKCLTEFWLFEITTHSKIISREILYTKSFFMKNQFF